MLLKHEGDRFVFLHHGYLENDLWKDAAWAGWMREHVHVAVYPRLVTSLSPLLNLAPDFWTLVKGDDPMRILVLVRDRWIFYSKWFVSGEAADPKLENSRAELRRLIAEMIVPCRGGGKTRLNQTVLQLSELDPEDIDATTFLQVPNPENSKWTCLRHFGVVVEHRLTQYIQLLRQMKNAAPSLE